MLFMYNFNFHSYLSSISGLSLDGDQSQQIYTSNSVVSLNWKHT